MVTKFGLDNCRVERRQIKDGDPVKVMMPFPVSVNSMFNQTNGRQRFPTQAYKDWQFNTERELQNTKLGRVPGPVHLLFELGENDKRQRDLTNYVKGPEDMLVKHGVIDGDHAAVVRHVEIRWTTEVKGVRITITPWRNREAA